MSRLDYCNAVLHGAPTCAEHCSTNGSSGIETVSRSATTGTAALASGLSAYRLYKLAVLTYKIRSTSILIYLSRHIRARKNSENCAQLPFFLRAVTAQTDHSFRCTHHLGISSAPSAVNATPNPSLRLSVRHTPVLCQNQGTQRDAVFTVG